MLIFEIAELLWKTVVAMTMPLSTRTKKSRKTELLSGDILQNRGPSMRTRTEWLTRGGKRERWYNHPTGRVGCSQLCCDQAYWAQSISKGVSMYLRGVCWYQSLKLLPLCLIATCLVNCPNSSTNDIVLHVFNGTTDVLD